MYQQHYFLFIAQAPRVIAYNSRHLVRVIDVKAKNLSTSFMA